MIHLRHSQTVDAPLAQMWAATGDLHRIGDCFPGAAVTLVDGTCYEGTLSVAVGPLTLTYLGHGRVTERDEGAHTAVLVSGGHEKHGMGGADMTMRISVGAVDDPARSRVDIDTRIDVRGLPTPIGSGLAQAISDPLIEAFLRCLADPSCPGTAGADGADRLDALHTILPGMKSYAGRLLRRG